MATKLSICFVVLARYKKKTKKRTFRCIYGKRKKEKCIYLFFFGKGFAPLSMNEHDCMLCGITLGDGNRSVFSCGHVFHMSCLYGSAKQSYFICPTCPPQPAAATTTTTAAAASSQERIADFGDDPKTLKLRNFEQSMTEILPNYSSLNRRQIGAMLQQKEKNDQILTNTPLSRPQRVSAFAKKIAQSFAELDNMEGDFRLSLETNPKVMVRHSMSAEDMRKRNVDMQSIVRSGITMETLLDNQYTLNDFVLLTTTWTDIVALKLTANVWKRHKDALPMKDLVELFEITIHDIYISICQQSIVRLSQMGLSSDDLVSLKTTAQQLCIFGMTRADMSQFGFSMEEWVQKLKLTFAQLNTPPLQITKDDLGMNGLQWISIDNGDADAKQFEYLFDSQTLENLETTTIAPTTTTTGDDDIRVW